MQVANLKSGLYSSFLTVLTDIKIKQLVIQYSLDNPTHMGPEIRRIIRRFRIIESKEI